jgi:uracil-DNA glycosylase
LCFSVQPGVAVPRSLENIFSELQKDIPGFQRPKTGSLLKWAEQGVLLLNTVLTVAPHQANSHKGKGWEELTDAIIRIVCRHSTGIVFLLWGKPAQQKKSIISGSKNVVLESAHPSPLSASKGFFGCKHFSKANEILVRLGKDPVDWSLA